MIPIGFLIKIESTYGTDVGVRHVDFEYDARPLFDHAEKVKREASYYLDERTGRWETAYVPAFHYVPLGAVRIETTGRRL